MNFFKYLRWYHGRAEFHLNLFFEKNMWVVYVYIGGMLLEKGQIYDGEYAGQLFSRLAREEISSAISDAVGPMIPEKVMEAMCIKHDDDWEDVEDQASDYLNLWRCGFLDFWDFMDNKNKNLKRS